MRVPAVFLRSFSSYMRKINAILFSLLFFCVSLFADDNSSNSSNPSLINVDSTRDFVLGFGEANDRRLVTLESQNGCYVEFQCTMIKFASLWCECQSCNTGCEVSCDSIWLRRWENDGNGPSSQRFQRFIPRGTSDFTFTYLWWSYHSEQTSGVIANIRIKNLGNCPMSPICIEQHCEYCGRDYCAVHDTHYTGHTEHDDNHHFLCANDMAIITAWRNNQTGYCENCGQNYCKLCVHQCGNSTCPNLPSCVSATCGVCGANYCSKHNLHVCSNYMETGIGFSQGGFTVQTSVSGQAQVTVNVSASTDYSSVLNSFSTSVNSNLSSLASSISNSVSSLSSSIDSHNSDVTQGIGDIDAKLESMKTILSGIHTDTGDLADIKRNTSAIASDTGSLSSAVTGIKTTLDDLKTSVTTGSQSVHNQSPDSGFTLGTTQVDDIDRYLDPDNGHTSLKVHFTDRIKAKLLPPYHIGSSSGSYPLSFDFPWFGSTRTFTIDLLSSDPLPTRIRQWLRAFFIVGYTVCFVTGVYTTLRQY